MKLTIATLILSHLAFLILSNPVEKREVETYPVIDDPTLTITYTYPGPYEGNDPAPNQWIPVLTALETDLSTLSIPPSNGPVNEYSQGESDVGAYIAFRGYEGGNLPASERLVKVLKTLEGVKAQKARIEVRDEVAGIVAIGCSSSGARPCVVNLE